MADFVATIHVQDGQAVWRATEVPHLTADSLYRFEPVPDPVVPRAELRRVTNAEWRQGLAGKALTARELASLNRMCRTAGLSPLPEKLRYSQWGAHLEVCNHEADARGWLVCLMPPKDPHHDERICWALAADEHRKLLQSLLDSGEIEALMAGSFVPAEPGRIALDHLVLTRDALERFAGRMAIRVAVGSPNFEPNPEPKASAPERSRNGLGNRIGDDMMSLENAVENEPLRNAFAPVDLSPRLPQSALSPTQPKRLRKTWRNVAWAYVVERLRTGQFSTAIELNHALHTEAGAKESPFEKGEGHHRGSLWVRDIGKPLSSKTIQNAWGELCSAARER